MPPVGRVERLRDEPLDDPLLGRLLACRLELDLAGRRGDHGTEIGHPRRRQLLAEPDRALESRGADDLEVRYRDPDADARPLGDLGRPPGEVRQLGQQLLHERRDDDRGTPSAASSNRVRSWRMIEIS